MDGWTVQTDRAKFIGPSGRTGGPNGIKQY